MKKHNSFLVKTRGQKEQLQWSPQNMFLTCFQKVQFNLQMLFYSFLTRICNKIFLVINLFRTCCVLSFLLKIFSLAGRAWIPAFVTLMGQEALPTAISMQALWLKMWSLCRVPYARHYKPRLVFFLTHFSLRLIFQSGLYCRASYISRFFFSKSKVKKNGIASTYLKFFSYYYFFLTLR